MVPEHDFAFVLLTNSTAGPALQMSLLDEAPARYPGLAGSVRKYGNSAVQRWNPTAVVPTDAQADEVVGRYTIPEKVVVLERGDSGLTGMVESTDVPDAVGPKHDAPPQAPAPMKFVGPDLGRAGGLLMKFLRAPDGK